MTTASQPLSADPLAVPPTANEKPHFFYKSLKMKVSGLPTTKKSWFEKLCDEGKYRS